MKNRKLLLKNAGTVLIVLVLSAMIGFVLIELVHRVIN